MARLYWLLFKKRNVSSRIHLYLSLYLVITAVLLLTASGRIGLSDSVAMLNVAQSIIDDGSLSSDPCEPDVHNPDAGASIGCIPGSGGRHYAGYGLVPSLLVVPAIACARSISERFHVNRLITVKAAASLFTVLVASLVPVVLAMWILKLGYSRSTAASGACILAFASPFWNNSVMGFLSEPYFTLALLITACLLSNPRRRFACALTGLTFGLACGTRVNGVILFPAIIFSMVWNRRVHRLSMTQLLSRDLMPFCASFSIFAILIALANYVRFGSPFKTGYHLAFPSISILLSTPFFEGLTNLLFSGEIGLLIYAPWVLAVLICCPRFAQVHPSESVLCWASSVIYLLFFAKYIDFHGGTVAGPRLLIPILPLLIVTISPVIQHFTHSRQRPWIASSSLLLVFGIAFVVQLVSTMFPVVRYYTLMEFYKSKPTQPWWRGSIPLASFDFLSHMRPAWQTRADTEFDQQTARHESELAFLSSHSAETEDEFLDRFPNSVNMTAPNLLWLKMKLMGLPNSFVVAYLFGVITLGCVGTVWLFWFVPALERTKRLPGNSEEVATLTQKT